MNINDLEQWAMARATSLPVVLAIFELAKNNASRADKIWERPSRTQIKKVEQRAWELADEEVNELYWGYDTICR